MKIPHQNYWGSHGNAQASLPLLRQQPRVFAFSLVEVVMALAIFSFAIVSILGVMPNALSSMQSSTSRAVSARLLEQVGVEASQMGTNPPGDFVATFPRFFDVEGLPLKSAAGAIYRMDLSIRSSAGAVSSGAQTVPIHQETMLVAPVHARVLLFQLAGLAGWKGDSLSLIQALER